MNCRQGSPSPAHVSVKRNYLYQVLYQLLVIAAPLVTTPYVSRVLGEEGIGAYGWAQSVSTGFMLVASLGIAMYGQREIAYHRDSPEGYSAIFEELVILRGISVIAGILVYLALFTRLGRFPALFLVQSLDLIGVIFDISWFFQGMEDFKKVVGRNAAVKCLSILCVFLFVKDADDLVIYALCLSVSGFLGNLSLWPGVLRQIRWIPLNHLNMTRHLLPVLHLFLPQIAIQIYAFMDKTMLGFLNPDIAQNGYYVQAQKLTKVSTALVTSLGTVMMPRISYLFYGSEIKKVREMLKGNFQFAAFMGCGLTFGLAGISGNLVPWFYGDGFEPVETVLYLLCPSILMISLSNVSGMQCLIPMKKQKEFNVSVIAASFCNLLFNILLIPSRGAAGACIGTVSAEFTVLVLQFYFIKDLITLGDIRIFILRDSFAGGIMLLALRILGNFLAPAPAATVLEIGAGFLLYCTILFLTGDELLRGGVWECVRIIKKASGK